MGDFDLLIYSAGQGKDYHVYEEFRVPRRGIDGVEGAKVSQMGTRPTRSPVTGNFSYWDPFANLMGSFRREGGETYKVISFASMCVVTHTVEGRPLRSHLNIT